MPLPILALLACLTLATGPAAAMDGTITIEDPYARAASPQAKSGAAYMRLMNHGSEDDRLIAVASDAAQRVELHTHFADSGGVMRMVKVEDGIAVPAGGMAALRRGGDHVMFMGLTAPFIDGETVPVILVFENAGEIAVEIPVDLNRRPGTGTQHGHGGHGATN